MLNTRYHLITFNLNNNMKPVKERIKTMQDMLSETLFVANSETQWINNKIESITDLK